ncbi:helix-turn-helix domain-containing protein [Alicyclobacillus tolerans]|uniref:helix-turn-helix domain-containing protein n=1 Tax=Alicyclobacillus tolerans TaxID=90970 RepID=UPI001F439CB0|nr:helix-turn-helix domain-containing protein [Alicyclobacillus tolerans]MCF8567042.1 helix-turn-helix domain-containing protein [Alicyclobacillus tolerans]
MAHISGAFTIQSTATNQTTRIEMIWGSRLLDEGFTAIPNILLRNYRKLGIDHNEWGLLCVLLSYKHDARDPYPEQETLAQNLGLSVRQVRNLTTSLQSKGFLIVGRRRNQRTQKYGSLVYNLSPLMNKLLEI